MILAFNFASVQIAKICARDEFGLLCSRTESSGLNNKNNNNKLAQCLGGRASGRKQKNKRTEKKNTWVMHNHKQQQQKRRGLLIKSNQIRSIRIIEL